MPIISRLTILLTLLSLGHAVQAGNHTVTIGQVVAPISVDDVYCALDESQTFDRAWMTFQRRSNGAQNHVLGAFMLCSDLDTLRGGEAISLSRFIIIMSPKQASGELQPRPLTGISREQFYTGIGQSFKDGIEVDHDEITETINKTAEEMAGSGQHSPIDIESDGQPYFLSQSENAVFAGLAMTVSNEDQVNKLGCVLGMTLYENYMLSVNVYRNFKSPHTINRLLAETDEIMDSIFAN